MGLFSFVKKITKGIKKVVKKVGRGIKKVVKKVGNAFGKLGVVGAIGLSILMPYAAPALGSLFGAAGAAATSALTSTLGGVGASIASGVGKVIGLAGQFGAKVGSFAKSLTGGVTSFIGDLAGAAANKLGLGNVFPKLADKTFTSAFENLMGSVAEAGAKGADIFSPASYSWGQSTASAASAAQGSAANSANAGYKGIMERPKTLADKVVDAAKSEVKDFVESVPQRIVNRGVEEIKQRVLGEDYGDANEQFYSTFDQDFANTYASLQASSYTPNQISNFTAADYMPQPALQYANANPYGAGAQVYNLYQEQLNRVTQPGFQFNYATVS